MSTTTITTHPKPVSEPSDSGIVPVSWLPYKYKTLQSRSQTVTASHIRISTASITTHLKPVSEPSDSGIVPVSWLPYKYKSLQSRSQTVTASHITISVHSQHHHSPQASQRAERLWDRASQVVGVEDDFRGVAIHGGTIFAQDYDNSKCILFK